MTPLDLANQLRLRFGNLVSEPVEFRGESTVRIEDPERLPEVCRHARNVLALDFLTDITSVDNYGTEPRWTVVYELYSLDQRCHLRLKVTVDETTSELPSLTNIWSTADWHEREIYDMMGIRFRGHPNPRRILMWDGYPHFPLRKDFPLAGKPTELPGVAFSREAPLEDGPFVTRAGAKDAVAREPRSRRRTESG